MMILYPRVICLYFHYLPQHLDCDDCRGLKRLLEEEEEIALDALPGPVSMEVGKVRTYKMKLSPVLG